MLGAATIEAARQILYPLVEDADAAVTVETYKDGKLWVAGVSIGTRDSTLSLTERGLNVAEAAGRLYARLAQVQLETA